MFHFDPEVECSEGEAWATSYQWAFISKNYWYRLGGYVLPMRNEFNWDAVKNNVRDNPKASFRALGHIVHLLQDLSVPAHVRNDPHVVRADPLEAYAEGMFKIEALWPEMPTEQLIDKGPEDLFIDLQKYTHENFFSLDTIFKNFPEPRPDAEDSIYFYKNSLKIAHKGKDYLSYLPYDKQHCDFNDTIIKEHFRVLTRKAIIYTASLIYHFYKENSFLPGLVAHYRFDNNLLDSSGNGNHGTTVGEISFGYGILGKAAKFNGIDSAVLIPDSPSLRLNTFTLCAWVKPDKIEGGNRIIEKGESNSYWLDINPSSVPLVGFFDGSFNDQQAQLEIPGVGIGQHKLSTDRWYFIAGSYDGSSLKIYVNGVLHMPLSISSRPDQNNQPLMIGWKHNGITSDHFSGLIDEVKIYNRALSTEEIAGLYKQRPAVSPQIFNTNFINNGAGTTTSTELTINLSAKDTFGIDAYTYCLLVGDEWLVTKQRELLLAVVQANNEGSGLGTLIHIDQVTKIYNQDIQHQFSGKPGDKVITILGFRNVVGNWSFKSDIIGYQPAMNASLNNSSSEFYRPGPNNLAPPPGTVILAPPPSISSRPEYEVQAAPGSSLSDEASRTPQKKQGIPDMASYDQTPLVRDVGSTIAGEAVLPPPDGLGLVGAAGQVTMVWHAAAGDFTGFVIQRQDLAGPGDFVEIARLAAPPSLADAAVHWTDTQVKAKETYRYRIAAFNASGVSAFTPSLEVTVR